MKFLVVCIIIILAVTSFASTKYISLPYKQTLDKERLSDTVNFNFEIKDSNGNPLGNVLVIIQGISNQEFNENLFTDNDGKASISLNKNEIFVYTIYKLSYEEKTGNFFTSSDENIQITLNKIPDNNWYFYYVNNGEIEVKFKSLDADTNYNVDEYINNVLEIRNVAGINIDLIKDKTFFKTIDSETLRQLRWWGNLKPYEILIDLSLKKDGWVRVTMQNDIFEVCVGNAVGSYKDHPFDLSDNEYICQTEDKKGTSASNLIPKWMLKGTYKFHMGIAYKINNQEKIFDLLTQEFFIDNIEWKPEIDSSPQTDIKINEKWTYNITPKYPFHFVYYSLEKVPEDMKIDTEKGNVSWIPTINGNYDIIVKAYYPYFYDDYKTAYNEQSFTLNVTGEQAGNIYPDNLYIFNKSVKVGEEIKASFEVYNNCSNENSFSYKIQTGNNNSITYKINNIKPYSKRTIYTSWKYSVAGIYSPVLIIDSDNKINETDENDNIKYFQNIEVRN